MKIHPLSKAIFDKAISLGVTEIHLNFSGGSDEGYLNVSVLPYDEKEGLEFEKEIEDWAWQVYDYSGAGDGNDYGDDVVYDLANKKVKTSEWATERVDGAEEMEPLIAGE